MTMSNSQRVGDALKLLSKGLAPFAERELRSTYGSEWAATVVELLDMEPYQAKKVSLDDVQFQLKVMWKLWQPVFGKVLGQSERTLVSELIDARNDWAHQKAFSTDDAYRALDTIQRLLTAVSADEADELEESKHELIEIRRAEYSRRKSKQTTAALFETAAAAGLQPWREVVQPHADVAGGRYQQAEFAADLHLVYQGGAASEYQDPAEFFRRTFITAGLHKLLTQAIERLNGSGGDPVVDLQTNFGGGKTHSLLALYHIAGGTPANELLGVEDLLKEAGVGALPQANRAVLVGTKIGPGTVHSKSDGTKVHTLWGELAWQLGGAEGYALVADADRTATNPGTALERLFKTYAPCLVLIDEWVAYARQLYGAEDLPAGTFDTHFTFAQALTEAATAVPDTLVVISIPASDSVRHGLSAGESALNDIEVGGEGGKVALERLRSVISRTEASWQPATAEEGFEIVRRRLFQPLDAQAAREREAIAKVFRAFYAQHKSEFPSECGEGAYERRMVNAYPIHPELFDRLYNDWSTLARFQRTRGVLRLMANVIHELWESGDQSPLIMPASVPLSSPLVSFELTRYLEEAWKPIIDTEIDGASSLPVRLDNENPSFGKIRACRRATRTVFLGSAATLRGPNKGIDDRRIKLGSLLPGESPALIGDALRRMSELSAHLYTETGRYWFDTQASVLQTARDRIAQVTEDQWQAELLKRLRGEQTARGDFAGVHVAPGSDGDVADEDRARLVILGPEHPHTSKTEGTAARAAAAQILERHGSGPRRYRNMVVFLAPDRTRLAELEAALRQYLAWASIENDKEMLGLTPHAERQAGSQRAAASEAASQRIPETYQWLLVPSQDKDAPEVVWQETKISGQGTLAERASRKMVNDGTLAAQYAGVLLRMELDRVPLWPAGSGFVNLKRVWDYFAQYLYLPRLKHSQVFLEAVRQGVNSLSWQVDTFAYAQAVDDDGRFLGLVTGHADTSIMLNDTSVLVRPDAALRQIEADAAAEREFTDRGGALFTPTGEQPPLGGDGLEGAELGAAGAAGRDVGFGVVGSGAGGFDGVGFGAAGSGGAGSSGGGPGGLAAKPKLARRFYGVVELDPTRLNKQVPEVVEHVVEHLTKLTGAKVRVKLEIDADVADGVPSKTVMDVTENARTLKFSDFGFEEE
jgi:predicted AAA+ superfamily ATPase